MFEDKAKMLITALKSGEYKKGKGKLCAIADNGEKYFCCLGVLSELAIKDGLILNKKEDTWMGSDKRIIYEHSAYSLSESTSKWSGINNEEKNNLIELNDAEDADTWNEVINYLENLEYKK